MSARAIVKSDCELDGCESHLIPTLFAYVRQVREVGLLVVGLLLLCLGYALPDLTVWYYRDSATHAPASDKALARIEEPSWHCSVLTSCGTAGNEDKPSGKGATADTSPSREKPKEDPCQPGCLEPTVLTNAFSVGLLVLAGWLVLWRILRFMMWREFHQRGLSMRPKIGKGGKLLRGQKRMVAELEGLLLDFDLDQPGPAIALRGSWGSGKSHVITALINRLEQEHKGEAAAIFLSVWREQSERDLHLDIVEAILSHPRILSTCFSSYSNHIVLRKIGRAVVQWLPRGLHFNNGTLDAHMDPGGALPLLAQRDLELVVARARAKCLRIVLVLDEVDRATIEVAQSALVLTKRSLNLPGLAVILAYVEEQLRLKVFNPRHNHVPELHQTFLMNVEHHLSETEKKEAGLTTTFIEFKYLVDAVLRQNAGEPGNKSEPGTRSVELVYRYWELQRQMRDELITKAFLSFSAARRGRLIAQSESKYLSLKRDIPPLEPCDALEVLRFRTLRSTLPDFPDLDEATWRDCLARIIDGVVKQASSNVGHLPAPAIRHLEGRLFHWIPLLGEIRLRTKKNPDGSTLWEVKPYEDHPELTLICLTALAWRSAQLMTR